MRMIRQSPEQLVLLHRPLLLCGILSGGAVLVLVVALWALAGGGWIKALVGLLCALGFAAPALWFGMERVDVVFDAAAGTCTLDTRRLSGSQQEIYRLDQIDRAMIQTHKTPHDTKGAHRAALLLVPGRPEDERPLTAGYTGPKAANDLVARINGWLDMHRPDGSGSL